MSLSGGDIGDVQIGTNVQFNELSRQIGCNPMQYCEPLNLS